MNKKSFRPARVLGPFFAAALVLTLSGCVSEPSHRSARVRSASVSVQGAVIVEDDYVYYPGYEVYYSNNRRNYIYRDGRNWVTRSAPPRVAINVLLASPSVRVDFHDSPERHHDKVVRSYPRNWRPAEANRDDRRENQRGEKRDDDNHRKGEGDGNDRKRD